MLAIPRWVAMCKAFCLRWVPSREVLLLHACLNRAAMLVPDSPVVNVPVNEGPHWAYLISVSSSFFAVVFSVDTERFEHDASSVCVNIFIILHWNMYFITYCEWFSFPFIIYISSFWWEIHCIKNKIWSLWSEVTWQWKIEEFSLNVFCWMFHLPKPTLCCSWHFLNAYQTWERLISLIELYLH